MINQLEIQNFQSHKDTTLVFDPHVNIIMGTSHSGKSAIIRALRWATQNAPKGFGFRRHGVPKKEETAVTLTMGNGGVVTRKRNDTSTNGYAVNGLELEAMRGVVPEEVTSMLNMTKLNIQSQFTPYFLIGETAGEVARIINSYTGMEIIDAVQKSAIGANGTATACVNVLSSQVETAQEEVQRYAPIKLLEDVAEKVKEAYQKLQDTLQLGEELRHDIDMLVEIKQSLGAAEKIAALRVHLNCVVVDMGTRGTLTTNLSQLGDLLSMIKTSQAGIQKLQPILTQAQYITLRGTQLEERTLIISEMMQLQTLLHEIVTFEETIADYQYDLELVPLITKCTNDFAQREVLEQKIEDVQSLLAGCIKLEEDIATATQKKKDALSVLGDVDVCPLCSQVVTGGIA